MREGGRGRGLIELSYENSRESKMILNVHHTKLLIIYKDILPGVGELMLASFPRDSNTFHCTSNPWYLFSSSLTLASSSIKQVCRWVGEKYDGMRACWNPLLKVLYLAC